MIPVPKTRPVIVLAAAALFLLAASPAWAQGGPDGEQSQHRRQGPQDLDGVMEHLTLELDLSDEQASEVRKVLEGQREQMQELRREFPPSDDPDDRAVMREHARRILEENDEQLAEILDEDQMQQYRRMRRGSRHRRQGGQDPPPNG